MVEITDQEIIATLGAIEPGSGKKMVKADCCCQGNDPQGDFFEFAKRACAGGLWRYEAEAPGLYCNFCSHSGGYPGWTDECLF
jgi:hypothetical protein